MPSPPSSSVAPPCRAGAGNVRGTLVGAFVIGFLADGLVILGVSTFWQIFIKGSVIILAVILDQGQQRFQRKSMAAAATVKAIQQHEAHTDLPTVPDDLHPSGDRPWSHAEGGTSQLTSTTHHTTAS